MNPYQYSLTTRLKEDWVLKFLNPRPGDRILDVGCGLGYFISLMNQRGVEPYGLDYSVESLKYVSRENRGHFVSCSAEALPFASDSFDKILFADVIEHLENDEAAVAEIARVARNGAKVVVVTPPLEGLLSGTRLNLLCHDIPGRPEYHFRPGYKTSDLVSLLGRYHIVVQQVEYTTVLLGELMIEGMKAVYSLKTQGFSAQADVMEMNKSLLFRAYRNLLFPSMFWVSKMEAKLLAKYLKGHEVIVNGLVCKG